LLRPTGLEGLSYKLLTEFIIDEDVEEERQSIEAEVAPVERA